MVLLKQTGRLRHSQSIGGSPVHSIRSSLNETSRFVRLSPKRRGELESFAPEIRNLDGELLVEFQQWLESRQQHVSEKEKNGQRGRHEGHYTRGETVSGIKAPEHQAKLALAQFVEREPPPARIESNEIKSTADSQNDTVVNGWLGRWLDKYIGRNSVRSSDQGT